MSTQDTNVSVFLGKAGVVLIAAARATVTETFGLAAQLLLADEGERGAEALVVGNSTWARHARVRSFVWFGCLRQPSGRSLLSRTPKKETIAW